MIRTKKDELDPDFIGDQNSLTKEEEKALNEYFKQKKESLKLAERKKTVTKSKTATK